MSLDYSIAYFLLCREIRIFSFVMVAGSFLGVTSAMTSDCNATSSDSKRTQQETFVHDDQHIARDRHYRHVTLQRDALPDDADDVTEVEQFQAMMHPLEGSDVLEE
jgi:hypothetical protein